MNDKTHNKSIGGITTYMKIVFQNKYYVNRKLLIIILNKKISSVIEYMDHINFITHFLQITYID